MRFLRQFPKQLICIFTNIYFTEYSFIITDNNDDVSDASAKESIDIGDEAAQAVAQLSRTTTIDSKETEPDIKEEDEEEDNTETVEDKKEYNLLDDTIENLEIINQTNGKELFPGICLKVTVAVNFEKEETQK